MNKSKAKHVLYGTLYIVQMYRYGSLDAHSYTAGIFDNEYDAKACGIAEAFWRANKYEPVIYEHNLNEWRNGTKQAMFEEIKNNNHNKENVDQLYTRKESFEWRMKREDPEEYVKIQVDKMKAEREEYLDKYKKFAAQYIDDTNDSDSDS